ncbi:MAG: hypothetical protein AAGA69_05375 [Pseudomonadota bacterium]
MTVSKRVITTALCAALCCTAASASQRTSAQDRDMRGLSSVIAEEGMPLDIRNFATGCLGPLNELLASESIGRDQSLSSTGIPGCQYPGADGVTVGNAVDNVLITVNARRVSP